MSDLHRFIRRAPGVLGLVLVAASGCGVRRTLECMRGGPPPQPPSFAEARESYQRACAPCHGADARGGGPVARALAVPPPDLTVLAARAGGRFPRDAVIDVIAGEREVAAHGTREMPVWSQRFGPSASGAPAVAALYARRRLELLADFLASLQADGAPPVP
jgi:hypothetical protein